MAILKKRVLKQAIGAKQERSEILSSHNKYKDTLEDLVNSLDIERPTTQKPIDLLSNEISTSDPEVDDNPLDRSQGQQ